MYDAEFVKHAKFHKNLLRTHGNMKPWTFQLYKEVQTIETCGLLLKYGRGTYAHHYVLESCNGDKTQQNYTKSVSTWTCIQKHEKYYESASASTDFFFPVWLIHSILLSFLDSSSCWVDFCFYQNTKNVDIAWFRWSVPLSAGKKTPSFVSFPDKIYICQSIPKSLHVVRHIRL